MSQLPLKLESQMHTLIVTHQQARWHANQHHDHSKVNHKDQEVSSDQIPGNPHPSPKTDGTILPTYEPMKLPTPTKNNNSIHRCFPLLLRWPTLCRACFSLNKSTSYLSLCLSLNSFCHETSRT